MPGRVTELLPNLPKLLPVPELLLDWKLLPELLENLENLLLLGAPVFLSENGLKDFLPLDLPLVLLLNPPGLGNSSLLEDSSVLLLGPVWPNLRGGPSLLLPLLVCPNLRGGPSLLLPLLVCPNLRGGPSLLLPLLVCPNLRGGPDLLLPRLVCPVFLARGASAELLLLVRPNLAAPRTPLD